MVLAKLICSWLGTYIGLFFKDLDPSSFYFNPFRGLVELTNLELSDTLTHFHLSPVIAERAVVGKLRIYIPWTALYSRQCEVYLEDVIVFINPRHEMSEMSDLDKKRRMIKFLEMMHKKPSLDAHKRHGFLDRLKQIIIQNVSVTLTNCIIRYQNGNDVATSITLQWQGLTYSTCDNLGNDLFVTNDSDEYFRRIRFKELSLCVNEVMTRNEERNGPWYQDPLNELKHHFSEGVKKDVNGFGYLIGTTSGEFNCSLLKRSDSNCYGCHGVLVSEGINLNYDSVQAFLGMMRNVQTSWLFNSSNMRPMSKPSRSISGSCSSWWKYAGFLVIANAKKSPPKKRFIWPAYKKWKLQCEEYYSYYLSTLKAPWISAKSCNDTLLREIETSLSLDDMIQVRKQARYTLQRFYDEGEVCPRYFGENIRAQGAGHVVAVVEVLQDDQDSSVIYNEFTFSLQLSKFKINLGCCHGTVFALLQDIHFHIGFGRSSSESPVSFSALSIRFGSSLNGQDHVLVDVFEKDNNNKGFHISYIHESKIESAELRIIMASIRVHYKPLFIQEFVEDILNTKWMDFLRTFRNHTTADVNSNSSMIIGFCVQNATFVHEEVYISAHGLQLFPFFRCLCLYVSRHDGLPLIIASNVSVTSRDDTIALTGESYVHGDLLGFKMLRYLLSELMLDLRALQKLMMSTKSMKGKSRRISLEFRFPIFIVDLDGDSPPLDLEELIVSLVFGDMTLLDLNCKTMQSESLLTDTRLKVTISKGHYEGWESMNSSLFKSKAAMRFFVMLEGGHAALDNRFVSILEFLSDITWLMLTSPCQNSPIFRDDTLDSPFIEGAIWVSNMSFALYGEPSCAWKPPFVLSFSGENCLEMSMKRFSDTRMTMTLNLRRLFSLNVDNIEMIGMSELDEGGLQIDMSWLPPPSNCEVKERCTVIQFSILSFARYFAPYLAGFQELLRQFNEPLSPLYRLKSIGSRLHYTLRSSDQVYAAPFWPNRNIINIEAQNCVLMHLIQGKTISDGESESEAFLTVTVPSFTLHWIFDGVERSLGTEVHTLIGLPEVSKKPRFNDDTTSFANGTVFVEIKQNASLGEGENQETISLFLGGKNNRTRSNGLREMRMDQASSEDGIIVSLEEAYRLSMAINAVFSPKGASNLPNQNTGMQCQEERPKRVRLASLRVAPLVLCSPSCSLAFVCWDGVNGVFQDGGYAISTGTLSALCDNSLKGIDHNDIGLLWESIRAVKNNSCFAELTNRHSGNIPLQLTNFPETGNALLSVSGLFIYFNEESLSDFLHQIFLLKIRLHARMPSLIISTQLNRSVENAQIDNFGCNVSVVGDGGGVDCQDTYPNPKITFMINISEIHLGFLWYSRMQEMFAEIHCSILPFTLTSIGEATVDEASVSLKWYDTSSDSRIPLPSIIFFYDAQETVSLMEKISLKAIKPEYLFDSESKNGDVRLVVSPIKFHWTLITYLHIVELLMYHAKFDASYVAGGGESRDEEIPFSYSGSFTKETNSNSGSTVSFPLITPQSTSQFETESARRYSIEFVSLSLTISAESHQSKVTKCREEEAALWLRVENIVLQISPHTANLHVEEVVCGCRREARMFSLSHFQLSWPFGISLMYTLAEVGCAVECFAAVLTAPSVLECFDVICRAPLEEIVPLYSGAISLNESSDTKGNAKLYQTLSRKAPTVITVNSNVWQLTDDMVLSREGGTVLIFSSVNTNNIHVMMNGHSIVLKSSHKLDKNIVMVVDGGLSLTFSGGRFVLPWSVSDRRLLRRVEGLGEEAALLPFIALGEGSYIRCHNVRYAVSHNQTTHSSVTKNIQSQRDAQTHRKAPRHIRRWQLLLAIDSISLRVATHHEARMLHLTAGFELRTQLLDWKVDRGDAILQDFTVMTRATGTSSATSDSTLIAPFSIEVCNSMGRHFALSAGRVVVDVTNDDMVFLGAITKETGKLMGQIKSFHHSPAERSYDQQIQETLSWKSVGIRGELEEEADGNDQPMSDNNKQSHGNGKPSFSIAFFSTSVEVTLSELKYPLLNVSLSDVVWKESFYRTSRTTLVQNQRFSLRIYGKGRWDTVIPATAVMTFEASHSWTKQSSTVQRRLHCDGLVVHASNLLLSKIIHVNRRWTELQAALTSQRSKNLQELSETNSPLDDLFGKPLKTTHRFINTFDVVFYLLIGDDVEQGEIVPLLSSTEVDVTIPFNKADDLRLYLYPADFIELNEEGRHRLTLEGRNRDMRYSHVVASQLQYGQTVGLVIDDKLVVMSCVESSEGPITDSASIPISSTLGASLAMLPSSGNPSSSIKFRADEAGLVIVRMHARTTLFNGTDMLIETRQYLFAEQEEMPISEDYWIVPPNAEYPLSVTCSRVEVRISVNGIMYRASFSVLSIESGLFLSFTPCSDASLMSRSGYVEYGGYFPVSLFIAVRRYVESGSIAVVLLPRLTVRNHMGVPIKLSLWQEKSTSYNEAREASWSDWLSGGGVSPQRIIKIGECMELPHQGTIAINHCCYESSLFISLQFSQSGGEILKTEGAVKVSSSLKRDIEKEPRLLCVRDSNGRYFYVQVSVLHRTVILSVRLWVVNLTEYPILLSDHAISRQLSAGQMPNTGIPPSQGSPFLIGCRPKEFNMVFLTLGLDGDWSEGISTDVGSRGVAVSTLRGANLKRSCNYLLQFPRVQEGRPFVLLITPRWVFINNTGRRLKVHLESANIKKALAAEAAVIIANNAEGIAFPSASSLSSLSSVVLRPGEYHFSCIGGTKGNLVSFQNTLEDTVPSITSLSYSSVRHTNLAEFYEVHRTTPMSIDSTGHVAFNLWASLRQPSGIRSVMYGALTTLSATSPSPDAEDLDFVTGRIGITVQQSDNVLVVVADTIGATNLAIQNRTRCRTIAARQKSNPRRTLIPACQNRFFLWEDYRANPVISLHVIGIKGSWFEVDFARGTCLVTRRSTSDETEGQLTSFHVRAFTSAKDANCVTILFTDEAVPPHASLDAWHTTVGRTLSVPSLEFVWLTEKRLGSERPHVSLLLRELHVQIVEDDDSRNVSVVVQRLQLVDSREQTVVVLHRADVSSASLQEGARKCGGGGRGILRWLLRGGAVPQHDFQAVYVCIRSASGVTRVTELSCTLSPMAVDMSDHFVAAMWNECQVIRSILTAEGGGGGLGPNSHSPLQRSGQRMAIQQQLQVPFEFTSSVSRSAFSEALVGKFRAAGEFHGTPSLHFTTSAHVAANRTSSARSKRKEDVPALLFIDQAHFSDVTLFVTFSRRKPDPLQHLLGMYAFVLPKKIKQMEFSWSSFAVENDATTWSLFFSRAQQWLMDGALRQWTKVTRIGKVVDKFRGSGRVEISFAPPPLLTDINTEEAETSADTEEGILSIDRE